MATHRAPPVLSHRDLIDLLAATGTVVLVEALGQAFHESSHLPGALNIPPSVSDDALDRSLPDRDQPIVVYCSSRRTHAALLAHRLLDLGYSDVRVYGPGKEGWAEAGLALESGLA